MTQRPISYILAATDHGMMITNRFDQLINGNKGQGIHCALMEHSSWCRDECLSILALLDMRRASRGDGLVAIDCGANIGIMSIEMAKHMTGWGSVISFEPQQWVYYALCGNLAINNCFNAQAIWAAVSDRQGTIRVPVLDHQKYGSFSGLTLFKGADQSCVGQEVSFENTMPVSAVTIDSMGLDRVDFIKIDVEGMELFVLDGAKEMIEKHKPIILAEWIRCGKKALTAKLESFGYRIVTCDNMNLVGVHPDVELMAA